ncbi:MAG TPA: caspase family protein [Pyrinomonadaceae bacterium]|nr:caspase family protein [Pyrinomonadaceae bacterium]
MRVRPILSLFVVGVGLFASALTPLTARGQQREQGAPRPASPAGELYYALVIGNEDYDSLPKLGTAAKDARAVAGVLREYYGFQTRLLVNATRAEIVAALSAYGRELSADASLLVYYAGRGRRDAEAERAYWLPVDATGEDVSKWIAADEITTAVRAVAARHVLVVSDSCYSGALPVAALTPPSRPEDRERFLQKTAAGRSRTLLASGGDEPAADDGDDDHSVFAAALLRGLRWTEGPRFTASELFVGHVLNTVASRTGRIPVYYPLRNSGHEGGDFVFKRIKPVPAHGSCDDPEEKRKLYKTFLEYRRSNPEGQKVAYEVGKRYVSTYGHCPAESDKNVVAYIQKWLAKYEAAVREWERWNSRQP